MPLRHRAPIWFAVAVVAVSLGVALVVGGTRTAADRTPPGDAGGLAAEGADARPGTATASIGGAVVENAGPRSSTAPAISQPQAAAPGEVVDDNAYRLAVIDVNGRISEELDDLTRLLVSPRYGDPGWNAEVISVLDAMEDSARQARTIAAPPTFSQAHASWLEGIDSFEWTAQNMRSAIVGPDEALMRDCMDHIDTASARFRSAASLMTRTDAQ